MTGVSPGESSRPHTHTHLNPYNPSTSTPSRDEVSAAPSCARESQNETDSGRCCSCGSDIPFRQSVYIGVCDSCWNEAMGL